MTAATVLPHLTAGLNAVSLVLLVAGFALVWAGRRDLHRKVMASAVAVSAAFLVLYVVYHFSAPIFVFRGQGAVRPVYYALLVSHVALAALVAPMVALTLARAMQGNFVAHRRLARLTWPVWVYVSLSGLMVYVLLYHVYL
jgi:putative membrane protein